MKKQSKLFGEMNFRSNKYFEFKRVINEDEFILITENITLVKGNPVLIVNNNECVYLKDFQIHSVSSYDEGIYAWAVRLKREYFKVYTFKKDFQDVYFEKADTFDELLNLAKEQEKENIYFRKGWGNKSYVEYDMWKRNHLGR